MVFNSRTFSLIISIIVATLTTIFLTLIENVKTEVYFVAFSISLGSTFLLTYFTLQLFIFKEIEKLKKSFEKLQKKNFKEISSRKSKQSSGNPLTELSSEMKAFAYAKQLEITQLKKESEFRRDFLADVAHELKTPIFSAQGFIHTLLDGAMDDKEVSTRFLKKSAKSLDGLDNLVKDLMVISQIETGDLKLHFEYFNLSLVTTEIIEQLEHKASKKGTTINFESNDDIVESYGDANRIRQVLTNLIDNSIKYGIDNGSITVNLKSSSNKNKITISVTDNGPGIDSTHLDRIFERFYRIDKSRSRDTGGTGLGLAIVKHIIEAHDSTLKVESKINEGTKFTFVLNTPKED